MQNESSWTTYTSAARRRWSMRCRAGCERPASARRGFTANTSGRLSATATGPHRSAGHPGLQGQDRLDPPRLTLRPVRGMRLVLPLQRHEPTLAAVVLQQRAHRGHPAAAVGQRNITRRRSALHHTTRRVPKDDAGGRHMFCANRASSFPRKLLVLTRTARRYAGVQFRARFRSGLLLSQSAVAPRHPRMRTAS